MTEITISDEKNSFRFRESTDVGTYYQVFGSQGIELLVRLIWNCSLEDIKSEAQALYEQTSIKQQRQHMRTEYVRGKLFEAVSKLTDAQIRRV